MAVKLPKFPIQVQTKEGQKLLVIFKPTGLPGQAQLHFKETAGAKATVAVLKRMLPKEEVLSWGAFALETLRHEADSSATEPVAEPEIETPTPTPTGKIKIIKAKDALRDEAYVSWKSPTDPSKQHLTRFEDYDPTKDRAALWVLLNGDWSRVEVPGDYPLKVKVDADLGGVARLTKAGRDAQKKAIDAALEAKPAAKTPTASAPAKASPKKEGKKMPTKVAKVKPKTASVTEPKRQSSLGILTNKTVFETWGIAFGKFGGKPNAHKEIVAFMKTNFPEKPTKWAKWVNPVRARYNSGKLENTPKPKVPLAVIDPKGK